MTTNREQLINELGKLYNDIDQCIGDIVDSRLKKDYKAEGKALFRMEGLMVATLQDLECTINYLKLKQNEESQVETACSIGHFLLCFYILSVWISVKEQP